MPKNLLSVRNLCASVDGRRILNGAELEINAGEVHVLMGPNGAGKSTLANVVMGDPRYSVDEGRVFFEGADITEEKPDARARRGMFLSFQAPEEIPGITVENFLRAAKSAYTGEDVKLLPFRKELRARMEELGMDASYASRYLNVGFSGGEKKKNEILQMAVLNPKLAILDETDSGLDIDAVKTISESIHRHKNEENAIVIITHITRILQKLPVDYVHIMADGRIVKTSDASVIEKINRDGFASVLG
ncbi:Fe-S cluster assembly ATP-binding protein [Sporobacter termitidis DSM 10068]|uniref:Fe-S cluster assembly ATP-binding protein n=1 Tax=Sporobacter termitidis DSM 10068 TaxID=1123282 RepID=A0A1M5WIX6_9FIRM|nr:Fe-S cluster assembly ATPase SufC [Sporobacter termitidis]SHH87401.1 Fe-S cluster assembly ATP-binding protein [Sporobacter termitidis DSM 10068]